ncbi:hypothetical protein VH571_09275 [Frondihabitans sp. 4ASC-45]|uniref:hypothetical protein n=1 Tax=Frondihabitans sp. 4ASC-45 TaxID=3111636 RepID=UPI003C14D1A5
MPARRTLAIIGIVVVLALFVSIGIGAILVAGREFSKTDPQRTVSPSPTPTSTMAP